MCTAATGGGFGVRTHYENREEELFDYLRPQMMAAIKECAPSPDFQDRAIRIDLPTLDKERRRTEREFWAAFEKAAPRILGVLLDGVSCALRNMDQVEMKDLPRMADFAQAAMACAPAFGWTTEQFLTAYKANAADADAAVLDASLVVPFLPCPWEGTASELLSYLNDTMVSDGDFHKPLVPEQNRKTQILAEGRPGAR